MDVGLSITEITTSKGAIDRFDPEDRDCYTAEEVNLVSLPLKKGYREEKSSDAFKNRNQKPQNKVVISTQ